MQYIWAKSIYFCFLKQHLPFCSYMQYLCHSPFSLCSVGSWCTGTLYYSSTLKLTVSMVWMTWTHWRLARRTIMMIQMRYNLHLTAKDTIFYFNKVIELILSFYFLTSLGPSRVTDTWIIIKLYQILREKPQCLPFPWPSVCVYLRSSTYRIMTHILPNQFVFG